MFQSRFPAVRFPVRLRHLHRVPPQSSIRPLRLLQAPRRQTLNTGVNLQARRFVHQDHRDVAPARRGRTPASETAQTESPAGGSVYRIDQPFQVLILGGSYAGLAAALNLVDLCHGRRHRFSITDGDNGTGKRIPVQVTIVDPRDGYYHLIGQPLALSSQDFAESFWIKYSDIPALQTPEIRCVQGSVDSLDCAAKTATIATSSGTVQEKYDYLIICTGLRREYPSAPRSFTREQYLAETAKNLANVRGAKKGVAIIGGGAVGIEIAAECKMLHPSTPVTLIHSRNSLLSSEPLPNEFSSKTLEVLRESGVNVILGARVTSISEKNTDNTQTLTLSNNTTLPASHVINAVSRFTPTAPSFLPASICDDQGYIRIKPTLEFPSDTTHLPEGIAGDHYAAGDIARWSGVKRAGAAMHQGHYAARNIHQKMMQRVYGVAPEFVALDEVEPGMGLAVGEKAVAYFPSMGLAHGEETREMFFQGDLGFGICWRWMQLGTPMPGPVEVSAGESEREGENKPVGVAAAARAVEAAA